jgi:hypothetical protein
MFDIVRGTKGREPEACERTVHAALERQSPISELERLGCEAGPLELRRLELIRRIELEGEWDYGEYRDVYHWTASHLQISWIDAKRRVEAARVIEHFPLLSQALERGELSLDKVVQLTRFATPDTEARLIRWATTVSLKRVRETADESLRPDLEEVRRNDSWRSFGWRPIEGGSAYSFFGSLPVEEGALVASAIDRVAESLPALPHDTPEGCLASERAETLEQRRADALALLATQGIADDCDVDRATVVVHAPLEALAADQGAARLEDGGLLHPEVLERLTCDGRVQTVVHDGSGEPIGIGRVSQVVPPWLKRLVRHRDRTCTFPGCDDLRYNEAHHIRHWGKGGPTDLDNLVLVCGFHHKAVHGYGWSVTKAHDGTITWFRPSGRVHGVRLPLPAARAPADRSPPPPSPEPQQAELVPV